MIYLLLLLLSPTQQKIECEKLIMEKDCKQRNYCNWQCNQCIDNTSIAENRYCKLKQDGISCAEDEACAFNPNFECENFVGCQAYWNDNSRPIENDKDYCERISINCVSFPDSETCEDKPASCNFIENEKYCGIIATRLGDRTSCEWNGKCQFKGCRNAQLTYYSEKNCQNYNSACTYDGFECVEQLAPCNTRQKYNPTDCKRFISNTGSCQDSPNSQYCERASCYQYHGTSLEDCGQYFGRTGQSCFYDGNLFSELCLEYDYSEQIKQCIENEQQVSCGDKLSISKCFNINWSMYDNFIDFCFTYSITNKKYYSYRVDCSQHREKDVCNQAENQSMKHCQYNEQNDMCQTVETCRDYEINANSTDIDCGKIHNDCKLVIINNVKSYCLLRIPCYFYNSEQDCKAFNINDFSNPYYNLSQQCYWNKVNKKCRDYQCTDFGSDQILCNKFVGCFYIDENQKNCISRDNIICENLSASDCIFPHCVQLNSNCYTVNRQNIYNLKIEPTLKLIDNLENICYQYSSNLIYSPNTHYCHVRTSCQKYGLVNCGGMKDYNNLSCFEKKLEQESICSPSFQCDDFKLTTYQDCYKVSTNCTTNGVYCTSTLQKCSDYQSSNLCHFQSDSTKCIWDTKCRIQNCEDLNDCDSRNLCMDPSNCQENQCILNNNQCIILKSKCSDYNDQNKCLRSVQGYCYWNGSFCLNLTSCNLFDSDQCKLATDICNFDEKRNQCLNIQVKQDNCTNQISYTSYCSLASERPLKI